LNFLKIPKLTTFPKKKRKEEETSVTTMKKKNIQKKRIGENRVDGEILHLIALLEKIEFKFIINTKNQYKFQFT
jgi:hypothetical protein